MYVPVVKIDTQSYLSEVMRKVLLLFVDLFMIITCFFPNACPKAHQLLVSLVPKKYYSS